MNFDTIEVKKKINSILASFRKERQKESVAKTSGSGSDAFITLHGLHSNIIPFFFFSFLKVLP
nr:unnamed protein product [Callosobruchus chinensis]